MTGTTPKVDAYIERAEKWRAETEALRTVLLDCGLDEALKWGKPCYSVNNGNVAIIQGFKSFCSLMFFKGTLLKDPQGILVKQGENSQAALRLEFTSVQQVAEMDAVLRAYLREAIELEKAGRKVDFKKRRELVFPDELMEAFDEDPDLEAAFEALTPGRQRAYCLHFSGAKQSATRASRIEKCVPRILQGKGLTDR